jgi:hypothetical protein
MLRDFTGIKKLHDGHLFAPYRKRLAQCGHVTIPGEVSPSS